MQSLYPVRQGAEDQLRYGALLMFSLRYSLPILNGKQTSWDEGAGPYRDVATGSPIFPIFLERSLFSRPLSRQYGESGISVTASHRESSKTSWRPISPSRYYLLLGT